MFKPSSDRRSVSNSISISFVGKTNVELYELDLKICDGDRSAKTHLKIKLCSIISLSRLFHHGHVIHSQCIPEMSLYDRFQGENRECKNSQLHAHVVAKPSNLLILRRRFEEDLKNIC